MKRRVIGWTLLLAGGAGGAYYYYSGRGTGEQADAQQAAEVRPPRQGGGFGGGGFGGFFGPGSGGPRLPMTVELASVSRADMTEELTIVGNLIGAATVEAGPKVSGRLEAVFVKLGDRVSMGQRLAKIEDSELLEQVKQAEASFDVAAATIRQREADLRLAQTNLDRSRNLYERQLIPKQTYDDTDARHQAAAAQVDLARAQHAQAGARLDELKITVANTNILSPVSGFVGSRTLDPGAWVTPNSSFISVVDISVVRLVANVVERDLRRISAGLRANVSVDAFPGEWFQGRIAHVAPVLDPSTRTAQIEVEIANPGFRLKPGMYARVSFTVEHREKTLVVPANAVVDLAGRKGVFLPDEGDVARFHPITVGLVDPSRIEVIEGLTEGTRVVTTGAAALREGDKLVLLGQGQRGGSGQGGRGQGSSEGGMRGRRGGAS